MNTSNPLTLFFKVFGRRFGETKLTQGAGALTYSTMLAVVPLILVALAVFAAFPIFGELSDTLRQFLSENFPKNISQTLNDYLDQFIDNTRQMSIVGMGGLFVTSVLLIRTIDQALNNVFTQTKKRSLLLSFVMYALVLIFGPILLGITLGVSGYIASFHFFGEDQLPFGLSALKIIPFVLMWALFVFIYMVVPNTKIPFKYAAIGAIPAMIFFTLGRLAFAWYMQTFPSYQLIYGAMATLPILLFWIYLSWVFILMGALITSVLLDLHLAKIGKIAPTLNKEKPSEIERIIQDKQELEAINEKINEKVGK